MAELLNKVAIITGASSGIGAAAARLFAREGARVVVTARRRDLLDQLVLEIAGDGGQAVAVAGDVREPDLADLLVETAIDRFGGLDIAFNNAGSVGHPAPFPDLTEVEWREVLDLNLTSAFLCARRQVPAMIERGGGSLIFTSTFVGHTIGFPGLGAYAAAKAGLVGLTQVIAAELGQVGIRANALLPGGTDTPMGKQVANTPELQSFVAGLHALKRQARPEEIARAALFLASDASSFMTGTAMLVDGGVSITRT